MKIGLVTNSSWNLHQFRRPLIRRLLTEGHEVLLLAGIDAYSAGLSDLAGARFVALRHMRPQSRNPWSEWRLIRELYQVYRREQPDLLLHFTIKPNLYGSLVARWLGIPSIATLTGLGYAFIHDNPANRFIRQGYRWAFRGEVRVVFQNVDDRRLFLERGLARAEQSRLIPGSGVDIRYFQPVEKSEAKARFVFLYIGRVLYDKGIRELYEAARRIRRPGVECWVMGETLPNHPNGVPEAILRQWVDSGMIRYLGYQADVRAVLQQADVLVLPSYREGLPRSVLEAMAMGKPILTTDVPGCRATVEDGRNGFLFPARSETGLTHAMERLLALDEATRRAMGAYSRRKVELEFAEEVILEAYIQLIREEERRKSPEKNVH